MSDEHVQVVFKGDKKVDIITNQWSIPPDPKDSLKKAEDGEYILVNCMIALVSMDGQYALKEVSSIKAIVRTESLPYVKKTISVSDFPLSNLSESQRKIVINAFSDCNIPWAWKYATTEAKAALTGTLSIEDKARDIYYNAIKLYPSDSNYERFKTEIYKALKLAPKINVLRCELGKKAIENGHIDEAIKLFKDEIDLATDPKLLTAHSYLCAIFDAQGKSKEANLHANKATQTKEYKRMPSKLGPEVVSQIKESVRANKMAVTESVLEKYDARRKWWEFWK